MLEQEIEIITNDELEAVHANANFGNVSKRDVVRYGLLKCASGFHQGHTSTQIITEHGLINKEYELTAKGRSYLWAAFGKLSV